MNPVFKVLRYGWKTLNFIRDLVMNLFFLVFVLLLVTLVGLTGGGKKTAVNLSTDTGALLLTLDGYLADNRDDALNWQHALKELSGN